jgi:hypothetical protein
VQTLDRIAGAAVQLAELAPRLEALVAELESAVAELNGSAEHMNKALAAGRRTADHTRIVSINASIEAGRAGTAGGAFGAVVEEIKMLADASADSTREVESRVANISSAVHRVSQAAGSKGGAAEAGRQVRQLTDLLITSVGKFRFDAHAQAQKAIQGLLPSLASAGGDRIRLESVLEPWLREHPWFELVYATDSHGRQLTDNLRFGSGGIARDPSARDQNWAGRSWFQSALRSAEPCVSDLYRSAATQEFCFTVSAAWRNSAGALAGVVGADVSFGRIVLRMEQGALTAV